MINHDFSDDDDIKREIHNMFMRSEVIRRYSRCSIAVELLMFKAYYMCFYDANISLNYSIALFNKFRSCYNKCVNMFFWVQP